MAMKMRKGAAKQQPKRTQGVSAVVARTTIERVDKRNATIVVARREFVGSISNGAVTGFSVESNSGNVPGWDLNPAISGMFPWLSNIARGYERFRFRKLNVSLVSSQPTSTAGRIYAAVDYDWDDLVPTTKNALMGNMTAVEAPVWSNLDIRMDPKALMGDMPHKYVSTSTRDPSNGWEPRLSYCGFLIFAFDTPTANLLFDVFVDYEVELTVPQYEGTLPESTAASALVPGWTTDRDVWYDGAYGTTRTVIGNWVDGTLKGILRFVVGGQGTTPAFTLGNTGISRGLPAVDLAPLGNNKIIEFRAPVKHADCAPTTWTQYAALTSAALYDSVGSRLGDLVVNLKDQLWSLGMDFVKDEWAVTDKWAVPLVAITLASIRKAYPTARYAVPYMGCSSASFPTSTLGSAGIDVRVY